MSKKTPKARYYVQKADAKRRGIEFKLTFEQWKGWWITNLGHNWFELRGKGPQQYCMGRKGDLGAYEIGNIECITNSANSSFCIKNIRATRDIIRKSFNDKIIKLTAEQAIEIYSMNGTQKSIAEKFQVSQRLVRMIKAKQVWQHALDEGGGSF